MESQRAHFSFVTVMALVATLLPALAVAPAEAAFPGEVGRIAWSKLGNTPPVLYTLWTMEPDGSDKQQVPYNDFVGRGVSNDGNFFGVQTPVWNAAGTTLAGTVRLNCVYGSGCGAALGTVDPASGTVRTLTCAGNYAHPNPGHECVSPEQDPTWSPAGDELAFIARAPDCPSNDTPSDDPCWRHANNVLWKLTIDSCPTDTASPCADRTPLTPLANEPMPPPNEKSAAVITDHMDPSWSPHGSAIVVARQRDARPSGGGVDNDLVVVAADGSGAVEGSDTTSNLTADLPGVFMYPDWAPDASAVFAVYSNPSPRLVRLGVACEPGSSRCVRTSFDIVYTPPHGMSMWDTAVSPDGHRIAFTAFSAALEGTHILTIDVDGTDLAQLTTTAADGSSNSHPTWQPQDPEPDPPPPCEGTDCDPPPPCDPAVCDDDVPECTILGTAGEDVLIGTAGDDVMCGLGGNDTLDGGEGDDVLRGGPGHDDLFGRDGDDRLLGADGNDSLRGGRGNDALEGGEGYDAILYIDSPAPVTIDLGNGSGRGDGDDQLSSIEAVHGSPLSDTLLGSAADDQLLGGDSDDYIDGRGGQDLLGGGNGDDTLFGGSGDDLLVGGEHVDTSDGGPGQDTCYSSDRRRISCELPSGNDVGSGTPPPDDELTPPDGEIVTDDSGSTSTSEGERGRVAPMSMDARMRYYYLGHSDYLVVWNATATWQFTPTIMGPSGWEGQVCNWLRRTTLSVACRANNALNATDKWRSRWFIHNARIRGSCAVFIMDYGRHGIFQQKGWKTRPAIDFGSGLGVPWITPGRYTRVKVSDPSWVGTPYFDVTC